MVVLTIRKTASGDVEVFARPACVRVLKPLVHEAVVQWFTDNAVMLADLTIDTGMATVMRMHEHDCDLDVDCTCLPD